MMPEDKGDIHINQAIIPFSAVVVTFNEAKRLHACLKSLRFCEQILVVDLGSTDNSVEIAKGMGADVMYCDRSPIVEKIRQKAIKHAAYDWVVFLDPDEVFPVKAVESILEMIRNSPVTGLVKVPWAFYVHGKLLRSTIWGMKRYKDVVVHKDRIRMEPYVHHGISLIDGYSFKSLPHIQDFSIKHFWMDTYFQLMEKHIRYLKDEGQARYLSGERFLLRKMIRESTFSLKYSLIDCHGIKDGAKGILLSFFYSFYILMSHVALYRYEKNMMGS